jgi:hypothetical protein
MRTLDPGRHRGPAGMKTELRQILGAGVAEDEARRALAGAAEDWGGEWDEEKGLLTLAVTAGLRVGWVRGPVRFEGPLEGDPLELCYRVEESSFSLQASAVAFLLMAAAGGLFTMIWPFFGYRFPDLIQLAPLAALLALGGWFLVVARLKSSGPEEFLAAAAKLAEGPEG